MIGLFGWQTMTPMTDTSKTNACLPTEVVFAPEWWHHNEGLTFDEDFFFHPARRVEAERRMEKALYERWGKYGLGKEKDRDLPVVGAVHLAAGFMLSEMLGCKVDYKESAPPQVVPALRQDLKVSAKDAFETPVYRKFEKLLEQLKERFGFLVGDVNWGGILNLALDVRGEQIFLDMHDKPEGVNAFFSEINALIETFTRAIHKQTCSTSISVNRNVINIDGPVFLHSECTHTMIPVESYEAFLFEHDARWSRMFRPFGIHYCGPDAHRYADAFARLPHLDFLDVGWGGDLRRLRKRLPNTFLNIRLSPVEIIDSTPAEIETTVSRLVADAGDPTLTGICCINMDDKVSDDKVTAIFETVEKLREMEMKP